MDTEVSESMDITKLKVPELRKELKSRGLPTAGNKNELLERLQLAIKNKLDDMSAESVDDLDDLQDLLNDDDDEHIDETECEFNLDATLDGKVAKRKSEEESTEVPKVKKIVLNRNLSSVEDIIKEDPVKEETKNGEEKKIIKLSELSAKERLEMRAKKFGVTITGDAMKVARAERFGGNSVNSKANAVDTSVDVLKKRAERFGVNVSTTLSKLENMERLEKRKERFSLTVNGDKAAARLERFKQPVK